VLSVQEEGSFASRRQKVLQCPEIAAISGLDCERSRTERAILQALVDAAAASKGKNVSLLRNIGMEIPEDPTKLAFLQLQPLFVPAKTFPTAAETVLDTDKVTRNTSSATASSSPEKDPIDADEIYQIIRNIQDPEHPLTLEQLGVVSRQQIYVHENGLLDVRFTPTIPHCSMATLIGLCIRVKLHRSLTSNRQSFKVTVRIEPGTHQSEVSVNKQLADKERVCAALENKHLAGVVNRCIGNGMSGNMAAAV
jgi:metal-sulfur cluster biosynthetic enzyme